MSEATHPPIVYVEWRDSMAATSGWVTVNESQRYAAEAWDNPLAAAGFLVDDTEHYVVLCVGWNPNPDEPEVNGAVMIPRSEIARLVRVGDVAQVDAASAPSPANGAERAPTHEE